ncbi:MAG: hypothetical protein H0X25_19215 [Acidobacteriales bacterium]|nr:hypothetical protein [Terriglobales bacterium]
MESVVSVFDSRDKAQSAYESLVQHHIPQESIILLSGQEDESKIDAVPTTDTERDGMGKTIGAFLGGVGGAGAGLGLGSAVASLLIPGVGPIIAIGIGAAAVLGVGGATAGAYIGKESETSADIGVPKDDTLFYHHLLRERKSILIVNVESGQQGNTVRSLLKDEGAEDIDDARKHWKDAPE